MEGCECMQLHVCFHSVHVKVGLQVSPHLGKGIWMLAVLEFEGGWPVSAFRLAMGAFVRSYAWLYVGTGDLNSDPYICAGNPLPIELSQ